MALRCITFDLDDTLWECESVLEKAEKRFYDWVKIHASDLSAKYNPDALINHRIDYFQRFPELHYDLTRLRKKWLASLAADMGFSDEWAEKAFQVFWDARNEVEPYQQAIDLLDGLRERYRVGAITNGNADLVHIGIDHYFDFIVTSANAGSAKPSPGIFKQALHAAGVPASECLHVGDNPYADVQGARAQGMRTIWINPSCQPWPAGDPRPDAVVSHVGELTELLKLWM